MESGFRFEVWWSVFWKVVRLSRVTEPRFVNLKRKESFFESLEEGSHVWFSRLEEAVLEGIFEERLSRSFLKWFEFSCEMDFGTV